MTIAASPGQVIIEPDQQFIVTNNGHEMVTLTWNHRYYHIPPNEHRVVPFDAVRKHFGDPRSVPRTPQRYEDADGLKGDIPRREQEVERLSQLYGVFAGAKHGIESLEDLPNHPLIKDIVVETIDRIEIFCPAVDPDGTTSYAHREANDNVQDTASMLAAMQRRMDQQQALIDKLSGVVEEGPDDELSVDRPRFPE